MNGLAVKDLPSSLPENPVAMEQPTMAFSRTAYTFHLLGLTHLPVSREYMSCAFTQKVHKLSQMLLSLGHEVIVYGAEGSDVPCTEFVQTHTLSEIRGQWGDQGNDSGIGYDWKSQDFRHDISGSIVSPLTAKAQGRAVDAINRRKKPDHFLLVTQGRYQKRMAETVGLYLTVEPGIGYRGSWARFKAFESTYIMNFTYGSTQPFQSIDGSWYDRVIPNYFDLNDFEVLSKDDYYLFVGRMIQRKGIDIAVRASEAVGARLLLAGQGDYKTDYDKAEHVGYVGAEERALLMGRAIATFVPTIYLEPFGGVAVESMLCGTPVITTDFGAFSDTVVNGVTGYRCHTLQDFVDATEKVKGLCPYTIRRVAESKYSMDIVKMEFQRWFDDLYQLYRSATYTGVKGWSHLRQP